MARRGRLLHFWQVGALQLSMLLSLTDHPNFGYLTFRVEIKCIEGLNPVISYIL